MATEKILNTRIQLKYDKYETWVEKNPTLKSGELAIAYLSTSHTTTSPDNGTHAVMFKVGPGAFNSLPWASALAADVYSWAKRSEAEFAANFLAMQDSNGETMQTKLDNLFVTPSELNTALSNLQTNVLTDLSNRVKAIEDDYLKNADKTELEGKITSEETRAKGEEARIEGLVTAEASRADTEEERLAGLIADNAEDIAEIVDAENGILAQAKADATSKANAAQSAAEATAAADATSKANTAESNAKAYAEQQAAAAKSGAEKTASDALATARTEITAEIDADVKVEADRAKGVEAGLQSAIDAINGNDGILKQAKDYVDGEIDKVEAAIEDVIDGTTPVAKATDADKLGGFAAADYATKAYADQAETDAIAAAKKYTDDVKDAILGDGIKDTFDTLVEIQTWIEGDGVNVTELTEAIAAEAKTRGEEDAKLSKAIEDEAAAARAAEEQLGKDIDAEESRAKGEEARIEGLVTAEVSAREKAVSDEETARKAADKAIQDQIDALGIADGKVAEAKRADSAAMADKANSLTDAAKAEVKAVKVDNAAKADEATHATNADAATKATQDAAGNVITETYETKADAAQKLADAKSYADQAEADAIASAKSYTDGREAAIKTAYEAYADQAEADAKAYADGLAGNYATAAQGAKADTAVQTVVGDTGLKATKSGTEVTIGFDPDVVFVFNCGSATELVD